MPVTTTSFSLQLFMSNGNTLLSCLMSSSIEMIISFGFLQTCNVGKILESGPKSLGNLFI